MERVVCCGTGGHKEYHCQSVVVLVMVEIVFYLIGVRDGQQKLMMKSLGHRMEWSVRQDDDEIVVVL